MENSADPDQTPRAAASDQDLHCFPLHYTVYTVCAVLSVLIHSVITVFKIPSSSGRILLGSQTNEGFGLPQAAGFAIGSG